MIFVAQIDQKANSLHQGLGFSNQEAAQAHMTAHPEFIYISTAEFVGPSTHEYVDGAVVRKTA